MLNKTIIIPVWNEEETIASVIEEVLEEEYLNFLNFLNNTCVIIVDDGSDDRTGEILEEISKTTSQLQIIHIKHGGKDSALWSGIIASQTEWIGVMDSDKQNVPKNFEDLFKVAENEKADAVWGIRSCRKDGLIKIISSFCGRAIKKSLLKKCVVQDCGCGIFVARKQFLIEIIKACPKPYGQLHCHLPELIEAQKGKVIETEVHHRKRKEGTAKFGVFNRLIPGLFSLIQAKNIIKRIKRLNR